MGRSERALIIAARGAALSILLALVPVSVSAQRDGGWQGNPAELGHLPESGPAIVGGTGATTGPNSKNQATSPMPGNLDDDIKRRRLDNSLIPPDVRPVPGPAPKGR